MALFDPGFDLVVQHGGGNRSAGGRVDGVAVVPSRVRIIQSQDKEVNCMMTIVEGFYKQGNIELVEPPRGLQEGRVRVILIAEEQPKPPPSFLTFGKYGTGTMSTLEDFKDAEWHGEQELDDRHGE